MIASNEATPPGKRSESALLRTKAEAEATVVPEALKKVNTAFTNAVVVVLLLRTVPTKSVLPRASMGLPVTVVVK
jgi:hypothetical protein